jgi:phosphatidylglycerophosphate synthase
VTIGRRPAASDRAIVIDARPTVSGEPLALVIIGERPWLLRHLQAVERAGARHRASIWVEEPARAKIAAMMAVEGVTIPLTVVTSEQQPDPAALTLSVRQVFVEHLMVRRLRRRDGHLDPAVIMAIATPADIEKARQFVVRDQKLVASRYVNMRIARWLALRLRTTRITPNQVSVAGAVVAMLAVAAASVGTYRADVVSAILLEVALTIDLTDGYLARLTDRSSRFGNWLDTVFDELTSIGIIVGVVAGIVRAGGPTWAIVAGGVWIICFHLVSAEFWLAKAYGLPRYAASLEETGRRSAVLRLAYRAGRAVLMATQGLDSKFHVIAAGLLLGLKLPMVAFMTWGNLAAVVLVFAGRAAARDELR